MVSRGRNQETIKSAIQPPNERRDLSHFPGAILVGERDTSCLPSHGSPCKTISHEQLRGGALQQHAPFWEPCGYTPTVYVAVSQFAFLGNQPIVSSLVAIITTDRSSIKALLTVKRKTSRQGLKREITNSLLNFLI